MKHSHMLPLLVSVPLLLSHVNGQTNRQLEILLTVPKGTVETIDQTQTIVASFNQAMVPLKALTAVEAKAPMTVQPNLKGVYRWLGTKTLAFLPADTLPYATSFAVTIHAGTKSLSGQALKTEYRWEFETPRPRVISTSPYNGQRYVELDHSILIQFNQKIDPQKASEFVSLEERNAIQLAYPVFRSRQPTDDELKQGTQRYRPAIAKENSILIFPVIPFKKGCSYVVRCKAGLRGVEGPLGMSKEYTVSFTTYSELAFKGIAPPDRFSPGQPLHLLFSNPVSIREVARRLVFQPPMAFSADQLGYDYETDEPYLPLPLEAEREYKVTLKAGVQDRFGNRLLRDTTFTFHTGSFAPFVRMTTGPGVIEANEAHVYPVTFMNTDSVLLQQGPVAPERIVPLMRRLDFSSSSALEEDEGYAPDVDLRSEQAREYSVSRIWRMKDSRNRQQVHPVNLDEVLPGPRRGIVLLQIDNLRPEPERRYLKALLQVTNMGITAKFSPESNLIWVTRLSDATPIADASVELLNDSNEVVWTGKTDVAGLVQSPGWGRLGLMSPNEGQQPRQWIIVRNGDDIAFSSSEWQRGIEPWAFGIAADWQPKFEPLQGSAFTDRGLYKAGDNVEIKVIVRARSETGWKIPNGIAVRLTIRNPRNEEVYQKEHTLSPFGSFAVTLPLQSSSPLGYYSLVLESKRTRGKEQQWEDFGTGSFRVEAFRTAELEVTARSEKPSYIVGDTVTGYLSARYLFGAALKGERVIWRASATPAEWDPPGWQAYSFGPLAWLSRYTGRTGYQLLSSKQETLDAQGSIRIKTPLKVGEIGGTVSILLEGDVTAPSRQQISGRTSVIAHGGEFYIGIAPSSTFVQSDSTLTYSMITVTPEGKIVPGIEVSVKVMKRSWRSVRKAQSGGRYVWESESVDETADSTFLRTSDRPEQLKFKATQAGFFFIQAEGKDARSNRILTQCYFYVSGSGYVPWERSNDDRIELVADRSNYEPGDDAHLLVKSPYEEALALITVEREGIMRRFTRKLTGSAPEIDLPIQKEYLPNVFVSVVLLQGRRENPPKGATGVAPKESDVGRPSFKVGYAQLSVSPKEQHLALQVSTDRKEYRPGDSVQVAVNVKNASGEGVRSEVTLSVADLGVLQLIGYRLPDGFDSYYAERPLAVRTTETRIHIVEQREYGEKGEDAGGGGAEEKGLPLYDAQGIRKNFRSTAYWNPALATDVKGEVRISFKLPDNLTAFQIMAVAQTLASEFGYGETSIAVNKPLLLQPSFPRFARVGDSYEGGVVIHNYSAAEKKIVLHTSSSGVRSYGKDSSVHALMPGQALEVRSKFVAEKPGTATFTFLATSGEDADGLQWTLPILVSRPNESVALFETAADSVTKEKIVIPGAAYTDIGGVEFQTASTALVGLSNAVSYLFSYPYGCLEQRLSATLPLILAKDLVEAFHLEVYKNRDYRSVVVKTLDELFTFQRPGGGFAYWKNEPTEQPFVSAYAVYTMVQAKRHGYDVNSRVLENSLEYLRRALSNEVQYVQFGQPAWYCTRALILYTLALLEKPDYGYMEKLYTVRGELPLFAKAYLLRALHTAKGNQAMIQRLADDLTNGAKMSPTSAHFEERNSAGLAWVFDSNVRTSALVVQSLIESNPKNPLIPKVVRWLLDQRRNGIWRTTQENIYVIDALASYFTAFEKDEPDFRIFVDLGTKRVIDELFRGRSMNTTRAAVPMAQVKPGSEYPITLRKEGPGICYYGVRMTYAMKGETKEKEEGLTVVKTIEPLGGKARNDNSYGAGTVLRITLTLVSNQSRNFIVVNDPLPAGLEVITTSFQTTAMNLTQELDRKESGQGWTFNPFNHQESYDDQVLLFADFMPAGVHSYTYLARATSFGRFSMPSTRAEGMYEPEVFGQTGSRTVVIRN